MRGCSRLPDNATSWSALLPDPSGSSNRRTTPCRANDAPRSCLSRGCSINSIQNWPAPPKRSFLDGCSSTDEWSTIPAPRFAAVLVFVCSLLVAAAARPSWQTRWTLSRCRSPRSSPLTSAPLPAASPPPCSNARRPCLCSRCRVRTARRQPPSRPARRQPRADQHRGARRPPHTRGRRTGDDRPVLPVRRRRR